jgi:methylphosphotriester-DNA--protein-cysteine methyltransferase
MKTLRNFIVLLLLVACASQASDAQSVYITKTGKKYHRASCQYLRKSQIEISMKEAVDRGYTPCSVCTPGRPNEQKSSEKQQKTTGTKNGEVSKQPVVEKATTRSRQCSAITKAGTRCKRMTTTANGRCYQH